MKRIYEQTKIVEHLLFKQSVNATKKYRRIKYLAECPVKDGFLLMNTLTYEVLFFANEEKGLLNNPDLNDKTVQFLIEQYFLVPTDFDDKKFADQVIDTRFQIQSLYTEMPISFFVILTTTGCNARCFYCFEKGAKVSNMTEQTAHDVADFIERKGDKKVRIQWFGGEPLVNINAIDTICNDLREKNIDYVSTMVSNAYLLDEEAIRKCVDLWNMDRIQITLDGTEEVYNKVKNYVYKDVSSPFKRVLNNIENALKSGVQISIRLNMDEHNADDLFDLTKMLVDKFRTYKNCYIYTVRLFEDACATGHIIEKDIADRHKLIENSMRLQDYIDKNMPTPYIEHLPKAFQLPNTCMANSDKSVMIVPDGHLGKCEHFVDSDFFGSIYSDEYDIQKIIKYKEHIVIAPHCADCELRSLCMPLKCCGAIPRHCDDIDKMAVKARLFSKLNNVYNKFLEVEKEQTN